MNKEKTKLKELTRKEFEELIEKKIDEVLSRKGNMSFEQKSHIQDCIDHTNRARFDN